MRLNELTFPATMYGANEILLKAREHHEARQPNGYNRSSNETLTMRLDELKLPNSVGDASQILFKALDIRKWKTK